MKTSSSDNIDYGLLGEKLPHTLSPQIHSALFRESGYEGTYGLIECEKGQLTKAYDFLSKLKGYNITIPYKCDIIPYLHSLDESAQRYGAVNCVSNISGHSIGYNTDVDGFLGSLASNSIALSGRVLLLGCGGAGRMMAAEAVMAGASLTIAARKPEKVIETADEITKKFGGEIQVCSYSEIQGSFSLAINSTPVGMFPHTDECVISEEIISRCDAVFDAIYNPRETVLLRTARRMGKKTVGGMSMLVLQAAAAHKIWYGADFSQQQLDNIITEIQKLV